MLDEFFESEKIEYYKELSFSNLIITDKKKLSRLEEKYFPVKSAIIFLIPYYFGQKTTNLSVYAQSFDYHLYIKELSSRANEFAKIKGFFAFALADSSPVDERDAALKAGLCVKGENSLCINEKYGSYFFIGEIFLPFEISPASPISAKNCLLCGKCLEACPTNAIKEADKTSCLSYLTQKKALSEKEKALISEYPCKWGCDICQNICPMNENAQFTPIPYFQKRACEKLTKEITENPDFEKFAFSWRGKEVILRNLSLDK